MKMEEKQFNEEIAKINETYTPRINLKTFNNTLPSTPFELFNAKRRKITQENEPFDFNQSGSNFSPTDRMSADMINFTSSSDPKIGSDLYKDVLPQTQLVYYDDPNELVTRLNLLVSSQSVESIANELHRPVRKIFPRRSVVTRFIDELWQADLMDMQSNSKKKYGFKFILVVIDAYTKYAFVEPLKNKSEDDNDDDIDYEPEFIEQDDFSSDSEQSLFDENNLPAGDDDYFFYVGKDGETLWISNSDALNTTRRRTRAKNIVKIFPGPKAEKGEESRQRDFKSTSRNEIMALIGVLFLLAIKKGNRADIVEHWQSDGTGLVILRANFSYRRFLFLLRSLRLDDVTDRKDREKTDKLAAVREFQSDFVKNCQNSYSVGEFVTIDEMLVAFRGRCGFIQYMSQKPAKYGLKYYALCDSKTFYTYSLELYCGKQLVGPYGNNSNKPTDIVKRLVEPIKNSNRNLTTDNYYTSYPLAEYLLQVGLTLLGTMKRNKREIPPEFISEKNRQVGSSLSGFQNDMSLTSYVTKKKKCVIILSTMHDTVDIDPDTHKPETILDYNSTKGGVDSVDQMCSTYSTSRKTRRWTMTVLFRILDCNG
ncbi:hypothetical protein QTP88_021147 [Uroleucon formosanum]